MKTITDLVAGTAAEHLVAAPPAHGGKSGKTFAQFPFEKAVVEVLA